MRIGVIGGLTMDLFYHVDKFPQTGQAVEAKNYFLSPGGKALNISTAIKRFGEDVFLISSVGNDNLSEEIFESLSAEKINSEGILVQENIQTDLITVIVTPGGKPGFIGTRAANFYLTPQDIDRLENRISKLKAVIITMEIPSNTVKRGLEIAKKHNICTVLNPSPPDEFTVELLPLVDYFILNEHEASVCSNKTFVPEQVKYFSQNGAKKIIITSEEKGCDFWDGDKLTHFKSFPAKAVDSTGSGDTFCGVFVSALINNVSEEGSIQLASAGGALAAERHGSGLIIPTKLEIERLVKNH